MITWLRSLLAIALSAVLTALTFGRVELNRSGESTAEDDPDASRPAATQPLLDATPDALDNPDRAPVDGDD